MTCRILLLLVLHMATFARAADVYVPEELKAWQAWVLEGREYRQCPFYFDRKPDGERDHVCAWPGTLELDISGTDGRFSQRWSVTATEAWVPLPGDLAYWPDGVTVDGAAATVVLHDGVPSVRLEPGDHRLSGRFEWDRRPGLLRVPAQSGLVSLILDGKRIARPELDRDGVFLGERQRAEQVRDEARVQVYRLISDGVPTRMVTELQIDVSGSVREELFGPVLPEGFLPLAIQSVLPARVEADGRLRAQVRPGRWQVSLTARATDVRNTVTLPAADTNLPDSEIWSYRSNDRLRITAAAGLPPVDPLRAEVPERWSELPAYRIAKGETLEITERSRGLASAENELGLERSMWLDFDGGGFLVRDALGGTMRRDWRLDMRPPFVLKSATEGDENLLITNGEQPGSTGIELRSTDVDVVAIGRNDGRGPMPVTGWDARFVDVDTVLYLPPGHKLLTATGVGAADGSWIGQWQLLDFFLVLIIGIASWKLFGRAPGIIALLALGLSYHEVNAPSWLWLNLLIGVALLRVAPAGRLGTTVRAYLGVSALVLVFVLVPFLAGQLRVAIYPQLEPQWKVWEYGRQALRGPAAEAPPVSSDAAARHRQLAAKQSAEIMAHRAQPLEEIVVTGAASVTARFERYAPNAIVQAGPGIPSWQWNAYRLGWNGPVDANQTMRLVILPRWAVSLARCVGVALLLLFAAVLAAEIVKRRWRLPGGLTMGAKACVLLGIGAGMLAGPDAAAQMPDSDILRELEARLMQAPDCVPRCAEIVSAEVDVGGDDVSIRLTINALEEVAVPLPGSISGWRPTAVAVDSSVSAQVFRGADQTLWLRASRGRQAVVVRGGLAAADSVEIAFPAPPRVIEARGAGWFIAGIKDRRLLSGSLQLTRLRAEEDGDGAPRWESSRFPAFVEVQRRIELGLDWRVTTSVRRVAPEQGVLSVELPLIEGEAVLTGDLTVSDGAILVSMNPTQDRVTWQSNLARSSPLVLTSRAAAPWSEVWHVAVGPVWHAEFIGVPESEAGDRAGGGRMAEFHPRGGESLTIMATRPEAAAGETLAFDAVAVGIEQGARSRTASLGLSYRSTRGAQHVIRLPEGAEVTSVVIDGQAEPLRADGRELTLPVRPGEHEIGILWREDRGVGWAMRTPDIDVGAPVSNISLKASLGENRWLLATSGPRLGPAVLYWSELAFLVLIALMLGRIDWTPLKRPDWLLLGLGFSTFNWPALGLVAFWLVLVGARDKWRNDPPWWRYNLKQVGIIVLTAAALIAIVTSLPQGLLGTPDMHVTGNDSRGNHLAWFADRSESTLPVARAMTVPLWIYKSLILAWALWLSFALLRWLPWTWRCFARDGFFRSRRESSAGAPTGEG